MKTKSGKKAKWEHWVMICKNGKFFWYRNGKKHDGSFEFWIKTKKG